MASQSSITVFFRAVVMLGFMVAIPLVAIFGSALPGMVSDVLDGHWPAKKISEAFQRIRGGSSESDAATSTAPAFDPIVSPNGPTPASPGEPAELPRTNPSGRFIDSQPSWATSPAALHSSEVSPAAYQAPIDPQWADAGARRTPNADFGSPNPTAPVEVANPTRDPRSMSQLASPQTVSLGSAARDQLLAQYQQRLQEMGATYYLLEAWGDHQELFRFLCKMSLDGHRDYTQQFEATSSDPLDAMAQVLRQVEAWRNLRR